MNEVGLSEIFAITAPGIESVTASELLDLGIEGRIEPGGVTWSGSERELYAANLHLRTASRIVTRVARFRARSFIEMERHVKRIDWSPFAGQGTGIRLRVTSRKSRLYHEGAIAERFARMIEDHLGADVSQAAGDDEEAGSGAADAGQLFIVRFVRDECLVSADSSGALLHRRGYRQAVAKAPLRETLAAAMLLGSRWDAGAPLLDPFCGSGTIPIEGALIARRIPPGMANADRVPRPFAFEHWPRFRPDVWGGLVASARAGILDHGDGPIIGCDRDAGAIEAALMNAGRAGVEEDVIFAVQPISAAMPPPAAAPGWLVTNPPYGVRVGNSRPLRDLYATLGHVARERFSGWTVAMLATEDGLERQTGLRFFDSLRTRNGGIPVKLVVAGG